MSAKTKQPATVQALQVSRELLQSFQDTYKAYRTEVDIAEKNPNDISRIVNANFDIYKLLSSFLNNIRTYASQKNQSGNLIFVSIGDLNALETEREIRLLRSIVARNAQTLNLGTQFIASINPESLEKDLKKMMDNIGNESSNDSEENEEKNWQMVNIESTEGLYTIQDTSEAIDIEQLVGYQKEALEAVSFCRKINFVFNGENQNSSDNKTRNPTSIALYGPPGTGKTTIAQSLAKKMDTIFMYINADNIISKWAGGTEKNIAKIFRRARIASKQNNDRNILLLIDEIDGLLKNRSTSTSLTGEEYNRITTFLQMLTPPIGIDNSKLIVIFTTNRLENVDSAVINRCQGKIFMGYIVDPNDRILLFKNLFQSYVKQYKQYEHNFHIQYYDDIVPRDAQNILATVKNKILQNFTAKNSNRENVITPVNIDMNNENNLLNAENFFQILKEAIPATPATDYFNIYSPPVAHICQWLQKNGNLRTRSLEHFIQKSNLCR